MVSSKIVAFSFFYFLLMLPMKAQNLYEGTFMTSDGQFGMQMKTVDAGFQGILVANQTMYALNGTKTNNGLKGMVYSDAGNYSFFGSPIQGGWHITSEGTSYYFYQISTEHELAGLDLSPYFKKGSTTSQNSSTTQSSQNQNTKVSTNYAGISKQVYNNLAGSQLVYYQRTSYLNDSRASSLTYVNFCGDGRFSLNYDGGFSVEGDYGGNAHGVTRGSNYGTWKVETAPNKNPAVVLYYADGQSGRYYVNLANLQAGRWRIGNTQYALVKNKIYCGR
ncbi:hypothetical protein [Flagellimonas meridianipacifica]|uniref:Uncharacterized protein n=1 Tax=Flagellimonas meridianipacifica TaxID=1080225 RepID=A0A2T0MFF4_9FLAO|nr:hypothetical protein [Allomuricauda pacifica]PRX56308.1 hypothetical protein CLV81_0303 [Allomuricauda pacifica]